MTSFLNFILNILLAIVVAFVATTILQEVYFVYAGRGENWILSMLDKKYPLWFLVCMTILAVICNQMINSTMFDLKEGEIGVVSSIYTKNLGIVTSAFNVVFIGESLKETISTKPFSPIPLNIKVSLIDDDVDISGSIVASVDIGNALQFYAQGNSQHERIHVVNSNLLHVVERALQSTLSTFSYHDAVSSDNLTANVVNSTECVQMCRLLGILIRSIVVGKIAASNTYSRARTAIGVQDQIEEIAVRLMRKDQSISYRSAIKHARMITGSTKGHDVSLD